MRWFQWTKKFGNPCCNAFFVVYYSTVYVCFLFCLCLSCKPSKLQPPVRQWRTWPQGQPCLRLCIRCECVYIYSLSDAFIQRNSYSFHCIYFITHDFNVASAMYYQLICSVSLTRSFILNCVLHFSLAPIFCFPPCSTKSDSFFSRSALQIYISACQCVNILWLALGSG